MSARILVVDDNASNLDLMLYLLHAFGHETRAACNGIEGWEAAKSEPFDLILTDILMPGIDGYELAKRVASLPGRPPIVAVTALAMSGDRDRLMESGFDDYLSKPIDPTTFASQIEHYLALGRRGSDGNHSRR